MSARKIISYAVLTPTGERFMVSTDDVAELVDSGRVHVRQCDDGTIAVRSFWERRETFYMPNYRASRRAAA